MKTYRTLAAVHLPKGARMALSDQQAARRGARVKKLPDGTFEALEQLDFKRGETLGLAAVPRALAASLEAVQVQAARRAPAAG